MHEKIRVAMPEQEPQVRATNFEEVALGYTPEMAKQEAARCLKCKNPLCRQACPVGVDIPDFIGAICQDDMRGAIAALKRKNSLPAVCGRVCPQESQCESKCILGIKSEPIAIGRLERYVADTARSEALESVSGSSLAADAPKVAIIGSGPAGLAAAGELVGYGYAVTVFEALHTPGGVLMYGIPEFRLPKEIVQYEINNLKQRGVKFEVNSVIGSLYTVPELMSEEGFAAVFIGTGAGLPHFMNIPGENLNGVYSANEFLTRTNLMKAYDFPNHATPVFVGQTVAVVGGGNVAMDAARTAKRLGAQEVHIVYRRGKDGMPARLEEVHHAEQEGIIFDLLNNPVAIHGQDGWVTSLECVKMELGPVDASGRRSPVEIPGSNFRLPVQSVIMAIGQGPNPLVQKTTTGLVTDRRGNIPTDAQGQTNLEGVFAGGDIVTGAATVISAMGAGKAAAQSIHEYLSTKN